MAEINNELPDPYEAFLNQSNGAYYVFCEVPESLTDPDPEPMTLFFDPDEPTPQQPVSIGPSINAGMVLVGMAGKQYPDGRFQSFTQYNMQQMALQFTGDANFDPSNWLNIEEMQALQPTEDV